MNKPLNNIDLILPLLKFESDDDFYYLQILQRKKENHHLGSNSRVIKNYYIKSKEHLINRFEEIINLCEVFNARASIRLNKRSFVKVAFKTVVNIANSMSNGEYKFIRSCYDRACGQGHSSKEKTWLLDFDYNFEIDIKGEFEILKEHLYNIEPIGDKILEIIPSKAGFHVISKPFNTKQFMYEGVEIHKDNPTNLYIPNK